jgi:hypothetical protein
MASALIIKGNLNRVQNPRVLLDGYAEVMVALGEARGRVSEPVYEGNECDEKQRADSKPLEVIRPAILWLFLTVFEITHDGCCDEYKHQDSISC